jgi:hypothetical protein
VNAFPIAMTCSYGASEDGELSPNTEPVYVVKWRSPQRHSTFHKPAGASAPSIPERAVAIPCRTVIDVSHIAQGSGCRQRRLRRGFFFVMNESQQHQETLAHNLIVLSGAHGFATCVAAARSASQKGACYVPEGGPGVNPTAPGGSIPGLYFMTS